MTSRGPAWRSASRCRRKGGNCRRPTFAERALWNEYQQAYADAIAATNTAGAPWYLIPANHKWYRNWAVTTVLIETLEHLDPRYPTPPDRGSRAPSPVT